MVYSIVVTMLRAVYISGVHTSCGFFTRIPLSLSLSLQALFREIKDVSRLA